MTNLISGPGGVKQPQEFDFEFEGHQVRTIVDVDGDLLLVAADVCKALSIVNVSDAMDRLDADEKDDLVINDAIGRPQNYNLISESGLYSLIFSSRKPEARRFKKWVTAEVLPALRKTGMYALQRKTPEELALMHAQILVDHSHHLAQLDTRQDDVEDRLSRVEARQTAMIDTKSQNMTIDAYCIWKNIHTAVYNPQRLPALTNKAKQLSKERKYLIGKTANTRGGYDDTFHLDILTEIFAAF